MNDHDYEYDPEYQAAYQQTMEYQQRRLSYAIQDVGNEIGKEFLKIIVGTSSAVRALFSEFHADEVSRMGRLRLWWHVVTGHRK